MKKICVIFGGASVEHDVSIITGLQLADNIKSKYDVVKIYLGLDNNFYLASDANDPSDFVNKDKKRKQVTFLGGSLYKWSRLTIKRVCDVECVINCCHGGVGENGDLAGYMQINKIKMTSADSLSSHIAMDKSLAKQLIIDLGIPVVPGIKFDQSNIDQSRQKVASNLTFDLIVKPNSLGSSIGVKVCNQNDYTDQLDAIFEMNDDALVENRIINLCEYNQACYMRGGEIILSAIEEPRLKSSILSFDDKYMNSGKAKGGDRSVPADISNELEKMIGEYTERIYRGLKMSGVVRIDYIYDYDNGVLYFNEINTIPGSMAFYLYEPLGIDYITLVDDLIANSRDIKKYSYFSSGVLSKKLH